MRAARPAWLPALATAILIAASCARHPTAPGKAVIEGLVRDAGGQPVPGARISLLFDAPPGAGLPSPARASVPAAAPVVIGPVPVPPVPARGLFLYPNPCTSGIVNFSLLIPNHSQSVLAIRTRGGTILKTLVSGALAAGTHAIVWNGQDEVGAPLPADVYIADWTDIEGDSVFRFSERLLWEPVSAAQCFNAVTGSDGSFSLLIADLPLGETVQARDAVGNALGTATVAPRLRICATRTVGGIPESTCLSPVSLGSGNSGVAVTLTFP